MVTIDAIDKKAEIRYPCEWRYKVIGKEKKKIEQAVQSVMGGRIHQCQHANMSQKGHYHSYDVRTIVHNEDERTELFHRLKAHDDVTMVL